MKTSFCTEQHIQELTTLGPVLRAVMKAHGQEYEADEMKYVPSCRCGWEGVPTYVRDGAEFQLKEHRAEKPLEVK